MRKYVVAHDVDASLIGAATSMPTVASAAAALGVTPADSVKSVVFEGKRSACFGLAFVLGNGRVDRSKVATALGLPPVRLARPEVVRRATGFDVGGVPPIGHAERLPVVVDRSVLAQDVVFEVEAMSSTCSAFEARKSSVSPRR